MKFFSESITKRVVGYVVLIALIVQGCEGGCNGQDFRRITLNLLTGLYGQGESLVLGPEDTVFTYAPSWFQYDKMRLTPESGSVVRANPEKPFVVHIDVTSELHEMDAPGSNVKVKLWRLSYDSEEDKAVGECLAPCPRDLGSNRYRYSYDFGDTLVQYLSSTPAPKPSLVELGLSIPKSALSFEGGGHVTTEDSDLLFKFRYLLSYGVPEDTDPPRVRGISFDNNDVLPPSAPIWVRFTEGMGRVSVFVEEVPSDTYPNFDGIDTSDSYRLPVGPGENEGFLVNVLQMRNSELSLGEQFRMTLIGNERIGGLSFPPSADLAGTVLRQLVDVPIGTEMDWACGFQTYFARSVLFTPFLALFIPPDPSCLDVLTQQRLSTKNASVLFRTSKGKFTALGKNSDGETALPLYWRALPFDETHVVKTGYDEVADQGYIRNSAEVAASRFLEEDGQFNLFDEVVAPIEPKFIIRPSLLREYGNSKDTVVNNKIDFDTYALVGNRFVIVDSFERTICDASSQLPDGDLVKCGDEFDMSGPFISLDELGAVQEDSALGTDGRAQILMPVIGPVEMRAYHEVEGVRKLVDKTRFSVNADSLAPIRSSSDWVSSLLGPTIAPFLNAEYYCKGNIESIESVLNAFIQEIGFASSPSEILAVDEYIDEEGLDDLIPAHKLVAYLCAAIGKDRDDALAPIDNERTYVNEVPFLKNIGTFLGHVGAFLENHPDMLSPIAEDANQAIHFYQMVRDLGIELDEMSDDFIEKSAFGGESMVDKIAFEAQDAVETFCATMPEDCESRDYSQDFIMDAVRTRLIDQNTVFEIEAGDVNITVSNQDTGGGGNIGYIAQASNNYAFSSFRDGIAVPAFSIIPRDDIADAVPAISESDIPGSVIGAMRLGYGAKVVGDDFGNRWTIEKVGRGTADSATFCIIDGANLSPVYVDFNAHFDNGVSRSYGITVCKLEKACGSVDGRFNRQSTYWITNALTIDGRTRALFISSAAEDATFHGTASESCGFGDLLSRLVTKTATDSIFSIREYSRAARKYGKKIREKFEEHLPNIDTPFDSPLTKMDCGLLINALPPQIDGIPGLAEIYDRLEELRCIDLLAGKWTRRANGFLESMLRPAGQAAAGSLLIGSGSTIFTDNLGASSTIFRGVMYRPYVGMGRNR